MKEIDENYLLNQRDKEDSEDSYIFVFYNIEGCSTCEVNRKVVESVQENFPEIEFVSFKVKDVKSIPTFAPMMAPCYFLFLNGYKIHEANGFVDHRLMLIKIIRKWVLGE